MAPETVALVSAVSSAVVGVSVILFSWLTARGARIHERTMVREGRDQARREAFYVELLSGLTLFYSTLSLPEDAVDALRMTAPIPPPSLEELNAMISRAWLLGGPNVADLASRFLETWLEFDRARNAGADDDRLKELQEPVLQVLHDMRDAMRRDLHGDEG